jgi:glycosyltransferase involved in cell wall biosynthesis
MINTNNCGLREGGLHVNNIGANHTSSQPLISVITVSFNAGKHIRQSIESVKAQPFKNIEHIVMDGCSTDNTVNILEEYNLSLTYWRSEKDTGIYNAMNKALKIARGKWFLFLGADDELLNGFSKMAPLLKDENCIYYGDFVFETMRRAGGKFDAYRFSKACICHQNIFYPSAIFKKYQYDEKYSINADYYLNLQCWADKSIRFEYHPIVVAKFSSAGISNTAVDEQFEKDKGKNVKKYLGTLVYYRYLLKEFRKKITGKNK